MTPRPLYLDPAVPWLVRLEDGVALGIAGEGRTRSLYPLRRLSRVVCGRRAQWCSEALLACLEAGVPIVFTDTRRGTIGWCFGARRRETTLAQLLREGLTHPEWPSRFDAWLAAVQRREMRAALAALGQRTHRLDALHVRALLSNRLRQRIGAPAGRWLRALHLACGALAAEAAQRLVGDPALLAFARPGLHLPQTLAALLEWREHRLLHEWPLAELRSTPPERLAAMALESRSALLHRGCGEFLGDLELALREWLL